MKKKKKPINKNYSKKNYSVDNVFRNDWLNSSRIIGDEYFSVDI